MPLVDYGSSGESGDEENEIEEVKNEEQPQFQPQIKNTVNTVKEEVDESSDDPTIFSSLPKPRKQMTIHGNVDSLQNLLLNNKTLKGDGPNKKGHVKITIPSLNEFENDDAPKPEPKKMKPSTKQAGLFSVLPPPKNMSGKEAKLQLIPHVLKNQMSKPKPETLVNNKMKAENKTVTQINSAVDDDDDDDNSSTSYFGEGISNPVPKPTDYTGESSSMPIAVENNVQYEQPSNSTSDQMMAYYPEHYYPTQASMDGQVTEYETVPVNNEPLELDEKALQILCGGKRKRNQMPVNIIDLSGEEIMPDSKEWLLKQLTEERKTRTPGHRKTGSGPSVTSRRKHQITYLAFQAKAQELELQNQWSQNRMSRRQTQSKYGF